MKTARLVPVAAIVFSCTLARSRAADPQNQNEYVAKAARVNSAPRLDGHVDLDDEVWSAAEPITQFTQQLPDEGRPSSERTSVWIVYDRSNLYIGGICFTANPESIVVTEVRRDGVIENMDYFQLVLDTYHDHQNGFVFATNPAGMQYDGQVVQEGSSLGTITGRALSGAASRGNVSGFNVDWNGVWDVAASRTDRGWEFEMRIPFSTLRFKPGKNQSWGVNFLRNIRYRNEQAYWAPIPRNYDIFKVSLAGELQGLDLEQMLQRLEFKPFAVMGASRNFRNVAGSTEAVHDGGFDFKYKLTPQLTLDATYRTDFSQVEADDEQVNLDRFDLFFPEKRDFFLENDGFFRFGAPRESQIFFSRKIGLAPVSRTSFLPVPLLGGLRLSGKLERFNLGLLDIQSEGLDEAGIPAANFAVARVSRDIFAKSTIGAIFTNRQSENEGDWNRVAGADANFFFGDSLAVNGYIAKSSTAGLRGKDMAGRAAAQWKSSLWDLRGDFTRIQQNFQADLGFLQRTDVDKFNVHVAFSPVPANKKSWIRQWFPHVGWTEWHREGGGPLITRNVHMDFTLRLRNGGQVAFLRNERFERVEVPFRPFRNSQIRPGEYPYHEWQSVYESDPSKRLTYLGTLIFGEYFDGKRQSLSSNAGFRFTQKSQVKLRYEFNHVTFPSATTAQRDFASHIVGLNLLHSFSTRLLVQALIQYNNNTGEFSTNVRFSLLKIQGSNLFIVYNESRDALDLTPQSTLGRAFIIKYAYLFRGL